MWPEIWLWSFGCLCMCMVLGRIGPMCYSFIIIWYWSPVLSTSDMIKKKEKKILLNHRCMKKSSKSPWRELPSKTSPVPTQSSAGHLVAAQMQLRVSALLKDMSIVNAEGGEYYLTLPNSFPWCCGDLGKIYEAAVPSRFWKQVCDRKNASCFQSPAWRRKNMGGEHKWVKALNILVRKKRRNIHVFT